MVHGRPMTRVVGSVSAFQLHWAMLGALGTGKMGGGMGSDGLGWDLEFQERAHLGTVGEWPGAASTVLPPLWGDVELSPGGTWGPVSLVLVVVASPPAAPGPGGAPG